MRRVQCGLALRAAERAVRVCLKGQLDGVVAGGPTPTSAVRIFAANATHDVVAVQGHPGCPFAVKKTPNP